MKHKVNSSSRMLSLIGVLPFCLRACKSLVIWLNQNLSFLFPSNYMYKKTYQWFLLKRFLFLREGRYKLTKQWAFPFGICIYKKKIWPIRIVRHFHYSFIHLHWFKHKFFRVKICYFNKICTIHNVSRRIVKNY